MPCLVVGKLIDNALDAAAAGAEPRLARVDSPRAPTARCSIIVSDSGTGIRRAERARRGSTASRRSRRAPTVAASGSRLSGRSSRAPAEASMSRLSPTTFRVVLPGERHRDQRPARRRRRASPSSCTARSWPGSKDSGSWRSARCTRGHHGDPRDSPCRGHRPRAAGYDDARWHGARRAPARPGPGCRRRRHRRHAVRDAEVVQEDGRRSGSRSTLSSCSRSASSAIASSSTHVPPAHRTPQVRPLSPRRRDARRHAADATGSFRRGWSAETLDRVSTEVRVAGPGPGERDGPTARDVAGRGPPLPRAPRRGRSRDNVRSATAHPGVPSRRPLATLSPVQRGRDAADAAT